MDWNNLLFVIFPYVSLVVAIAVTIYRSVTRPFSISSLSSQILERKKRAQRALDRILDFVDVFITDAPEG